MYFTLTRIIEIPKNQPFKNDNNARDKVKNAAWRAFSLASSTAVGRVLPPSSRDQRVWSRCELLRQRLSTEMI